MNGEKEVKATGEGGGGGGGRILYSRLSALPSCLEDKDQLVYYIVSFYKIYLCLIAIGYVKRRWNVASYLMDSGKKKIIQFTEGSARDERNKS